VKNELKDIKSFSVVNLKIADMLKIYVGSKRISIINPLIIHIHILSQPRKLFLYLKG